jgi:catechol 2,3-dioxygenase-like lactoylglutathione lyase family enzyme
MRLHHVQVSCPAGGEDEGRHFYVEGLGFSEIAKPADLATRGGAWFRHAGGAEIHLGIEQPVVDRKAHPAIEVGTAEELEQLGAHLDSLGYEVDWSQRHNAEWFERFHTHDPFGNRIEVVHVLVPT